MYKFNSEDLVQLLYGDSSAERMIAINEELKNNWTLSEEFQLLSEGKNSLKMLKLSPRKKTIDNILKYAERSLGELTV